MLDPRPSWKLAYEFRDEYIGEEKPHQKLYTLDNLLTMCNAETIKIWGSIRMDEGFNKIKNIRFEIKDTLAKLTAKKDTVRGYYIQYIEKNKKNKMFGLDSFHFQSKLIELEYKQLNEHYIFIDNRIYCDYYKLYNILIVLYNQKFKTYTKQRNYPIYKYLEPFKQYDFDDINNIHYEIIEMIQHAYVLVSQNNDEINFDTQKLKSGFNIDNYVHNNIYKNTILLTNINLYEKYLNSYHIYHMNFLKNLLEKMGLFQKHLSTDLITETIVEPAKKTDDYEVILTNYEEFDDSESTIQIEPNFTETNIQLDTLIIKEYIEGIIVIGKEDNSLEITQEILQDNIMINDPIVLHEVSKEIPETKNKKARKKKR